MSEVAYEESVVDARHIRRMMSRDFAEKILIAIDGILIVTTAIATGAIYHIVAFESPGDIIQYATVGLLVATLVLPHLYLRGMFCLAEFQGLQQQLSVLFASWLTAFAVLLVLAFALKISDIFSRGFVTSFALVGLAILTLNRVAWRRLIEGAGTSGAFRGPKVLLITPRPKSSILEEELLAQNYQIRIRLNWPDENTSIAHFCFFAEVTRLLARSDIEQVIIECNTGQLTAIVPMVDAFRATPLPVHLVTDPELSLLIKKPCRRLGSSLAIELSSAPLSQLKRTLKRMFDLVVSACALVFFSPFLGFVALAIKLDSRGPVLFWQSRDGFNGRPFAIAKFRTMHVLENGPYVEAAKRNDPRVTRIGRWLRSTSIDELPQLWNVFRGQMSLVGPRPHAVAHNAHYTTLIAKYARRHHVKPGLTGWAQVQGFRGEAVTVEAMARRIELDIWYIENWNVMLDCKILLRTPYAVISCRNAY